MINIKSEHELTKMRKAGEVVALTQKLLEETICEGITTAELDRIAEEFIRSKGAIPSFKNYNGFKGSICASINDVVIHGIPGNTKLKDGDIIGLDIGALLDGFHGDMARTFGVGNISDEAKNLIAAAEGSFYAGIKNAVEGNRISDISAAVQKYAEGKGYSVVREFVGHGVGRNLHEDPEVPNYGRPGKGPRMYRGMTIAVEPMINAGRKEVYMAEDGWTVYTEDGSLSAHFENTIAITKGEPMILTVC